MGSWVDLHDSREEIQSEYTIEYSQKSYVRILMLDFGPFVEVYTPSQAHRGGGLPTQSLVSPSETELAISDGKGKRSPRRRRL